MRTYFSNGGAKMILLYVPINYGAGKVKPDLPFSKYFFFFFFLIGSGKSSNGPRFFPESSIVGEG
jgi:hypothetical protein